MNRLVIVSDAWHPQVNGVVRTLSMTVETLRRKGWSVSLVTPDLYRGLRTSRLAGLSIALPPYRMRDHLSGADYIHVATEGPLGLAAKRFCDEHRFRYTTAFHTNFPAYLHANFRVPERFSYAYFRWFHALSAAVMVPTPSMKAKLEARDFTNVRLWGRGVDTSIFSPRPAVVGFGTTYPRPYWLNVGRISKEKNLDAFLSLDLPGTKFVVGEGPDRSRLERRYPSTIFLGPRAGHHLAESYRAADVFVFPSRFDTFGLVNIEAIACGTPVAAFPATGPIDIIEDGVTGSLDEDLGNACLYALTLGRVSGDFSWETATNQFISHLVEARK